MAHFIAEEGPLKGLILKLEEGDEWIIGRDPDQAHLVLEDPTVSRKHALCFRQPDGISIKDLSHTNPCLVNDQLIPESVLLKEGDHIKIGNNTFLFSEEAPPEIFFEASPKEAIDVEEKTLFSEEPIPPPENFSDFESPSYDTIFEEKEEEEKHPFPFIPEESIILKVLSGPNAGAEFGIKKGKTYIIGKDPNTCDIVFNDLTVSKKHASLSIDAEGIFTLEDLGSRNGTFINNQLVQTPQILSSQDLIALGTTHFILIDRSAESETLYSPPPIAETLPEEESLEESLEPVEKEKIPWKEQVIPRKHLVVGSSILLIFFVAFISFFSLFKTHPIVVVEKDETSKIREIVQPYEDVQFSFNPKGTVLFLVGHILTTVDKEELLYRIKLLPFISEITDHLIIDELVIENMNQVLAENDSWKGITVHSPKAGKFEVIGTVPLPEDAQKLADYFSHYFPYAGRLENKVVVESFLNTQIASLLLSKGFGLLSFKVVQGELVLAGRYSMEEKDNFQKILKDMKTLPGIRTVKNLALETTPEMARIDLSDRYRISGVAKKDEKSFSVIVNGQVVTMGDFLDGMKITAIQSHTILLEKDGLKYTIKFAL